MLILTSGPSRFLGNRGGLIAPTPTYGAELIVNRTFDDASWWIIQADWTVGSGVATHTTPASTGGIYQNGLLSTSTWYLTQLDIGGRTAGSVRMDHHENYPHSSNGTRVWGSRSTGTTFVARAQNGFDGYIDNMTCKPITLASLFSMGDYGTHRIARAPWTIVLGARAGVIACADSKTNPQNFVIATCDGTNVYASKCVGGSYTSLFTLAATYVAGAAVEIRRLVGTDKFQIWYNGAQVGSDQTVSDAGIVNNTLWGWLNTWTGNTPAGAFSCVAS